PAGNGSSMTGSSDATGGYSNAVSAPVIKSSIDYPDWKCSVCGKMVTGHRNYCNYCGNGLRSEALKKMEEEKAKGNIAIPTKVTGNGSAGLWTCKKCGNKNPGSVEVCHSCGAIREN
ncbi:MAG: hypothetical protein J6Y89_01190, partial [Lachnospiraceae bacterium]|nr:hypothetical protein [Lachnospiraceae bacterium]